MGYKLKKWALILALVSVINPFCNDIAFSRGNSAVYYYNMGVDFQNNGKYTLAIKNYQKALSLNPKFSSARKNIMYAYLSLANNYCQNKKYTLAIQNYKKVLGINPKMAEVHYNLGLAYYNTGQNNLAIKSYEKALKLKPSLSEAKNNLIALYFNSGINYSNSGMYDNAVYCYKKALEYNPNDAKTYYNLGIVYNSLGRNEEAIQYYQKAVSIDPNYASASNNLEYSVKKVEEADLSAQIDKLVPAQKFPAEIQNLIRLNRSVNYAALGRLYEILDFIWSDPEGQRLLVVIMNNKIPINITRGSGDTNAHVSVTSYKNTLTYAGFPIFSYKTGQNKEISVNIGEDHILAFKNPNLPTHTRIYSFHAVVHELCHAAKNATSKANDNAMSEEIAASMIGYNIASKVIQGRSLTGKEAEEYAKNCMKAVLKDDHRFLPVYDNFISEIQKCGVYPPYPYLYQNVVQLYKSVRDDPEIQRVDTLERMIPN